MPDASFLTLRLAIERLKSTGDLSQLSAEIRGAPKNLEETFLFLLQELCHDELSSPYPILESLTWTANARQPLGLAQLSEALSTSLDSESLEATARVSEENLSEMTKRHPDLLVLDEDHHLRLVHVSLKDYLLSIGEKSSHGMQRLKDLQSSAHKNMAKSCLNYLLSVQETDLLISSEDDYVSLIRQKPFLQHAAQNWDIYTSMASTEDLHSLVEKMISSDQRRDFCMRQVLQSDDLFQERYKGQSTMLHILAVFGLVNIARLLPNSSSLISQPDQDGYLPLDCALLRGHEEISLWLLTCTKDSGNTHEITNIIKPLYVAAAFGWAEFITMAISIGCELDKLAGKQDPTPLMAAAQAGHISAIDALLAAGADVESATDYGRQPLTIAVEAEQAEATRVLLQAGSPVNACDNEGVTALHLAAFHNHVGIMSLLLDQGADPGLRTTGFACQLAIHSAAAEDGSEAIRYLFERGFKDVDCACSDGDTALHIAAREGKLAAASALLRLGADVDKRNHADNTPLHLASKVGHAAMISLLLQTSASVDLSTAEGNTALHLAANSEDYSSLFKLLEAGADVNTLSNPHLPPLVIAARHGCEDTAQALLTFDANVMVRGLFQSPPLHFAAQWGRKNMIDLLLRYGADADARNQHNDTALHFSARSCNFEFVEELLLKAKSLDINAVSSTGNTPLSLASSKGSAETVRILLRHGAKSIPDHSNHLPIHYAAWGGHEDIVRQLLAVEFNNEPGYLGRTPFHAAITTGNFGIASQFWDKISSLDDMDELGWPAILRCTLNGHVELVNELLDRKANPKVSNKDVFSLVHAAASKGYPALLGRLLDAGCDGASRTSLTRETPFQMAASSLSMETVDEFLRRNINGTHDVDMDDRNCVQRAAYEGGFEMLQKLHSLHANFTLPDSYGRNAMHEIAASGRVELLEFLRERSVDHCTPDILLRNALGQAATAGWYCLVERLLDLTPQPDLELCRKHSNQTALTSAAERRAPRVVEVLLAAGASPHKRDARGYSAIDYASLHEPTWNVMLRAGFSREAISEDDRKDLVFARALDNVNHLLSLFKHVSPSDSYIRASLICCLVDGFLSLKDEHIMDNYAKPLLPEIFIPPEDALHRAQYCCAFCGGAQFPGDKFFCTICSDVYLCKSCQEQRSRTASPNQAPEAYVTIESLEKQLLPLRDALLQHGCESIVQAALAVDRSSFLKDWLEDKRSEFESWELDHNSDGTYSRLERPGQAFVTLLKEALDLATSGASSTTAQSVLSEQIAKLDRRGRELQRKHRPDRDFIYWNCDGHKFEVISESDCKKVQADPNVMDETGRLTQRWIQQLRVFVEKEIQKRKSQQPLVTKAGGLDSAKTVESEDMISEKARSETMTSSLSAHGTEQVASAPDTDHPTDAIDSPLSVEKNTSETVDLSTVVPSAGYTMQVRNADLSEEEVLFEEPLSMSEAPSIGLTQLDKPSRKPAATAMGKLREIDWGNSLDETMVAGRRFTASQPKDTQRAFTWPDPSLMAQAQATGPRSATNSYRSPQQQAPKTVKRTVRLGTVELVYNPADRVIADTVLFLRLGEAIEAGYARACFRYKKLPDPLPSVLTEEQSALLSEDVLTITMSRQEIRSDEEDDRPGA